MGMKALAGVESLKKKKKPVKVVQQPLAEKHEQPEEQEEAQPVVVRVPRTTPSNLQKTVDKVAAGAGISDDGQLGKAVTTQLRRQQVMTWMLDGHMLDGELMSKDQLATKLGVPLMHVNQDIKTIKENMAKFYTEDDDTKEIAALAHMLLEMKFQDRGRALKLYNQVLADIRQADLDAERRHKTNPFAKGDGKLTGRDRAAMYSTALAAIDLSNRTTNGMQDLLKLTGGAKKLQLIIKAKEIHLNQQNNLTATSSRSIQNMIADMMGNVLPSARNNNKELAVPNFLQLTEEDASIIEIGEEGHTKKSKAKVIDAQPE